MMHSSVASGEAAPDQIVKPSGRKTPLTWILILLVAVCIFAAYCWITSSALRMRIAFAEDQTAIFNEMEVKAEAGDSAAAVGCLEYTLNYYPSGTKQLEGSQLDGIVERARQNAVRGIIDSLRKKTGADHGDDPRRWIKAIRERIKANESASHRSDSA